MTTKIAKVCSACLSDNITLYKVSARWHLDEQKWVLEEDVWGTPSCGDCGNEACNEVPA